MKDWKGNQNSIFKTLGASNHTDKERQVDDYYATDPIAVVKLISNIGLPHNLWECSCGEGHLSKKLIECGYNVYSSDLVDRGYGSTGVDFLGTDSLPFDGADDVGIITNPPYKMATEFVEHAMHLLPEGCPGIFLLKTTALEGKSRYERLYEKGWLKYVFQFSERLLCAKNGMFDEMKAGGGSAVAYAWFWFEKGNARDAVIKWI